MIRNVLIAVGALLMCLQQYISPVNINAQFYIFLTGIVLLGVPHGAADLLVATRNAAVSRKSFSNVRFLSIYTGRLVLFAATLWFFPVAGNLLFILFAAYHFGETDLYQFNTNTAIGKLFVVSYGMIILSVILLHHFEDIKPIFQLFKSGRENVVLIDWLDSNRYKIMSVTGIFFFTSTFIYFLKDNHSDKAGKGQFLIHLAFILLILFNLPMLLGFTFYFVVWHSVLSLNNIINYLKKNNTFSGNIIARQILFYSVLALAGLAIFGGVGFMFTNYNSIMGYLFSGLAVLTAPHMQIMHNMYNSLRSGSSI